VLGRRTIVLDSKVTRGAASEKKRRTVDGDPTPGVRPSNALEDEGRFVVRTIRLVG